MTAAALHGAQLILVEGLPGSGKSTTAQWLCHLLNAVGVEAAWYHEQDVEHPVYNYEELQAAMVSGPAACAAYHAAARERWRDVAARARQGAVTILDSSFLQSPIISMQLAGCSRDAIAHHIADTERILEPMAPALILLAQADVAAAYRHLRVSRGPTFEPFLLGLVRGTPYADTVDGPLALLRDHAVMLESFAGEVAMQMLRIDVSASRWAEHRLGITGFLGVPSVDPHPPAGEVGRFTGRYRDVGSDQELVVAADERGLLLQATGTRLLPRRGTTFEIEGLSVELTFEDGGDRGEGAQRMLVAARLANMGPVWVRSR